MFGVGSQYYSVVLARFHAHGHDGTKYTFYKDFRNIIQIDSAEAWCDHTEFHVALTMSSAAFIIPKSSVGCQSVYFFLNACLFQLHHHIQYQCHKRNGTVYRYLESNFNKISNQKNKKLWSHKTLLCETSAFNNGVAEDSAFS